MDAPMDEQKDGNGNRQDKRSADEIRPVFLKAGVISQARGSAYLEQNETKVICAVYGPRELVKREEFSMKGQLTSLAASITCASVALANAGIEMYDLVAGCSSRIAGDVLLMDPTEHEEYKSQVIA
ncbi:hypothetical protein KUTeg_000304 [Tegillarca granosa]|uniref:Exoribonuclease phosphorolytic domain-containing protein n=1 Tax=Tegillarca granosa TaxID=220873 RepID=A0ABQ9FX53_TEGGR|nr:hypothetical protein KUTeg_000304 [Tegillarca granosa]